MVFRVCPTFSLDFAGLGTYNNQFTTTGGDARPLTAANFAYVRGKMRSRKLENGLPMALGKLTCMVHPDLQTTAEQIFNTTFIAPAAAYGAIAAQASDNVLKGAADILVNPYLTSSDTWYLFANLGPMYPIVYQTRQPVKFVPLTNPTDANVFNINVYRYGADVRNAAGYSFPQLASQCGT